MAKLLADITPLKESPAFRRLWLGASVAAIGTQLTLVAVSLEVYRLTQESFYVGLLGIFALVPLVIAGVRGTASILALDPNLAVAQAWLSMLVFFDAVFLTLALWVFDPVMSE